jgi:RNA polymerase sigma factor (sigma-70 family)
LGTLHRRAGEAGQQNVMATSIWDDDAGRVPRHSPVKNVIVAAFSWSKRPGRRMTVHTKDAGADLRRSTLMAGAQAGDSVAYQTLLRDCIPVIKAIARRRGVALDHVDDVVQDVLLTIHRARHAYDPSRSFTAWLCVIAERRAIDLLRRVRRQNLREVHAPLAFESHADQAADPAQGLAYANMSSIVTSAIAGLPARQREAVEHMVLKERSLAEAAALTQRSKISLKVSLHRALKALRASVQAPRTRP